MHEFKECRTLALSFFLIYLDDNTCYKLVSLFRPCGVLNVIWIFIKREAHDLVQFRAREGCN